MTVRKSFNSAKRHCGNGYLHLLVLDTLDYLLVIRGYSHVPSFPCRFSLCKLQLPSLERRECLPFERSVNPVTLATRQLSNLDGRPSFQQPSLSLSFLVGIMMLCSLKFLFGQLHPQNVGRWDFEK